MSQQSVKFWTNDKFDYYLVSEEGALKVRCFKKNIPEVSFEYEVPVDHARRCWNLMAPEAFKALNQAIREIDGVLHG